MEQSITDLTARLTAHFQRTELRLSPVSGGQRVSGYMTWEQFEGVSQRERQLCLWDVIRSLPVSTQRQISSILALTPGERNFCLENVAEGGD